MSNDSGNGNAELDVIVVGAGIGGASCAALLAKRGLRTLLVEKNAIPGGKAMTVARGEMRYELWPVVSGPSIGSRFHELVEELEVADEVEFLTPDGAMALMYRTPEGELRTMIGNTSPGGAGGAGMVGLLGLREEDLAEVIRMQMDLSQATPEILAELDGVTFADWLARYEIPTSVRTYFAMQSNILFVVPIDELAASEAIRTLADFGKGGAGRYHAGGYGRVAEVCCEVVERHGGRVLFGTRVDRILVEDGRARGIVTSEGTFRARVVISNAGIQPSVLRLVGEEHFDASYVSRIRELVPSRAIIGKRYELDAPFFEHGMYITFSDENVMTSERFEALRSGWLPEEVSLFNVVPAVYDPDLAPPGRQTALIGTFCDPDPELDYLDALLERMDQSVERVWPGLHDHVTDVTEYTTSQVSRITRDSVLSHQGGECIGLAQIVGQCGAQKPEARSPLAGLYFVGCDAGGYGCGTHQAVDSGINVAGMVTADLG